MLSHSTCYDATIDGSRIKNGSADQKQKEAAKYILGTVSKLALRNGKSFDELFDNSYALENRAPRLSKSP